MSTKLDANRFIIDSISIESFRGYNDPYSFTFKEPVNVFFGKNGHGKSSTLYAIEWCLFGKVEFLPQLEGRARDEIINQSNHKGIARVKMLLRRGKEEVSIERTKKAGNANTTFTITTNEGAFEDEDAEKKFHLLFGMTIDDFIRAVYLHQEAIRALLTDKIADRDEALDRLFGLETMRNIVAGIPIKKIRDKIEDLESKKAALTKKIEGAVTLCQEDLRKLKVKTTEAGLSEEDIDIAFAVKSAKSIIKEIDAMAKEYSIEKHKIDEPAALEDFHTFELRAAKAIKEYEKQSIDQARIADLSTKKRRLKEFSDAVAEQEDPIQERQRQIGEIVDLLRN